MTSAPELPDVELIAYRQTDPGDHPHGGQCVGFSGVETADAWLLLVEQFRESLRHQVELAAREDQGDLLTRPMLFNAHHTVELATKAALVAQHKPARRTGMAGRLRRVFGRGNQDRPFPTTHGLFRLWKLLDRTEGARQLDDEVRAWARTLTKRLDKLTGSGIEVRYLAPTNGSAPLESVWCCVNASALLDCVDRYVAEIYGYLEIVAEPAVA